MAAETSEGPLRGITVVDLTSVFMGPYATMLLAQMGARVIKVEPPQGDAIRGVADTDGTGLGPIYLNANIGKESVVLDLRQEKDYLQLLEMVRKADVVAHNRPPGSDVRLGIDFETLSKVNPRLIVCGMHGYGSTGRYGQLPAYDDVIQAVSGLAAHQTGEGEPHFVRTPIADKVTGLLAVSAITAALLERTQSGLGQSIEVPMFETMVQFLLLEQQGGYVYEPPRGEAGYARTNSPNRKPHRTADGLIGVFPNTDAHWRAIFSAFDAEQMLADERFSTLRSRTEHINELYEWLSEQLGARTTNDALDLLQTAGVPAMPVNDIPSLFSDPHLLDVEFFRSIDHPEAGRLRQAKPSIRFSRTPVPDDLRPAPSLGSDTDRVLAEFQGSAGAGARAPGTNRAQS